ncbi:MAG: hypothetical protein K2N82_14535, partial [Lachnospiraceae bacterium]|nr:hypothetical protein [Lachnospiraceae bacterium]
MICYNENDYLLEENRIYDRAVWQRNESNACFTGTDTENKSGNAAGRRKEFLHRRNRMKAEKQY